MDEATAYEGIVDALLERLRRGNADLLSKLFPDEECREMADKLLAISQIVLADNVRMIQLLTTIKNVTAPAAMRLVAGREKEVMGNIHLACGQMLKVMSEAPGDEVESEVVRQIHEIIRKTEFV